MNRLIIVILTFVFISSSCFADCNWSTGITKLSNGNYQYTPECNLAVGKLVQDSAVKDKQIVDLTAGVKLKDAALDKADERAQLWQNSSLKLEDQALNVEKYKKDTEYVAFGLGILVSFAAASLANSLRGH